jgi:hypothetical protein
MNATNGYVMPVGARLTFGVLRLAEVAHEL